MKRFWFEFSDCVDSILSLKRESVVVQSESFDDDFVSVIDGRKSLEA